MHEIQKVTCDCDGNKVEHYVLIESYPAGTPWRGDLNQMIHDAALDFAILLRERESDLLNADMDYDFFLVTACDNFGEKYGFRKKVLNYGAKEVDGDRILLTKYEIERKMADLQAEKQKTETRQKIIQDFGRRMVPAAKKSPAPDQWTFYRMTKQISLWADEYIETFGPKDDPNAQYKFVNEKINLIRDSDSFEPPSDD